MGKQLLGWGRGKRGIWRASRLAKRGSGTPGGQGMTQAQLESGEIDAWECKGWKASL